MTREQWIEMWKSAKLIETNAKLLKSPPTKQAITYEVGKIKNLIQQEIGRME